MKTKLTIGATTLALTLITSTAMAKPPQGGPQDGPRTGERGGPQGSGQRGGEGRPPKAPPLIVALDVDKDGVISATEIEGASAALSTLDTNGDGQLTQDEIRPPRGGKGKPNE